MNAPKVGWRIVLTIAVFSLWRGALYFYNSLAQPYETINAMRRFEGLPAIESQADWQWLPIVSLMILLFSLILIWGTYLSGMFRKN